MKMLSTDLTVREVNLIKFYNYHSFGFQMAEYRVSIYGRKQSEWDQLASWFINNGIYSENAVWLIQVSKIQLFYLVFIFLGKYVNFLIGNL